MIVCAESTLHDLSVIVHEMGHLQYFMAFRNQPLIFQVKSITKYAYFSIHHSFPIPIPFEQKKKNEFN